MADDVENEYRNLLQLIRGEIWPFSPGIATYPDFPNDKNQASLYAACEELERRGLIQRRTIETKTYTQRGKIHTIPGCVMFFPKELAE